MSSKPDAVYQGLDECHVPQSYALNSNQKNGREPFKTRVQTLSVKNDFRIHCHCAIPTQHQLPEVNISSCGQAWITRDLMICIQMMFGYKQGHINLTVMSQTQNRKFIYFNLLTSTISSVCSAIYFHS